MSDLHLDINDRHETTPTGVWEHPDADLVAVAGDVGNGIESIKRLRDVFPNKPIVMVAGNHEFYGLFWNNAIDLLREEARKHDIVLLENESWNFQGVQFHGCTLWTDFEFYGIEERRYLMERMPSLIADYRFIGFSNDSFADSKDGGLRSGTFKNHVLNGDLQLAGVRTLSPFETIDRHHDSRKWLREQLTKDHGTPSVVITHHLPHVGSVNKAYQGNVSNGAFVSHCDDLFELPGAPDLWIHGHTHSAVNFKVGKTAVHCNPMGYPHGIEDSRLLENKDFDRQSLIAVPLNRPSDPSLDPSFDLRESATPARTIFFG